MSKKNPPNKKRLAASRNSWGSQNNKMMLDFSMLHNLSSLASNYKGSNVSIDQLLTLGKSNDKNGKIDDNMMFDQQNEDSMDGMDQFSKKQKVDDNKSKLSIDKVTTLANAISAVKSSEGKKLDKVDLREKAKEFFKEIQNHYGDKNVQISKSFVDTLQVSCFYEISYSQFMSYFSDF